MVLTLTLLSDDVVAMMMLMLMIVMTIVMMSSLLPLATSYCCYLPVSLLVSKLTHSLSIHSRPRLL